VASKAIVNLAAYFERIGYGGPTSVSVSTLHGITAAHVAAIPFENLDVLLGRPISLVPERIAQKLVAERRGGYCFEQNTLLLHVLEALGFQVRALSARVRVLRPRDFVPPRTHVFLRVELDGASWLTDVGVGGLSLSAALRLVADVEQSTPHEPRRIVREGDWSGFERRGPSARLFHQAYFAGAWQDVCDFTLEEMPEIDRVLGNWYTSAHPESHFRSRLIVARALPQGRVTLSNRELTVRQLDGSAVTQQIESPEQLLSLLAQHFSLHFPEGTRFTCPGLDWPDPR
jgi:N-hydroxyarylamine O-acetyltransferase